MSAICIDKVDMSYNDDETVLKNISFQLKSGSFHFLTGPSGAGKSSLLKLLYLAHKPSHGKITFFGEELENFSRDKRAELRRKIGIVFQDFRLLDHLTALENVALPLQIIGGDRKKIQTHAEELLEWVGLKDRIRVLPITLSGGEKQRVAIARAVITKPKLLLADEPTGNVDPEIGHRIMRLFVELNKTGTTTLIATHDQKLLETFQYPVLKLIKGRLSHAS